MQRYVLTIVTIALTATQSGCGESRGAGITARDSAGVQIVESQSAQWQQAARWRISAIPLLEIGMTEGEASYLFSRIAGALRLADGGVVVADGGTNQLRFFDANGRYQRAVGREGKGPGEFEHIRALKRCAADSIYAFDLNWQLKVYDLSGALKREAPLQQPGAGRPPYALNCSSNGRFVITGWGAQTRQPRIGLFSAIAPVSVLDASGAQVLQLGEFISSERIGTANGSGPHPFGKSTVLALAADQVHVGTNDAFEVRAYGMDGKLRRILRGPLTNLEIRPEHLERYRTDELARVPPERRPAMERYLRDMPMTKQFPAYSELQLDPDGNLWVRRFLRPGETQPLWAVFSLDGDCLGEVRTPTGMSIVEIGADYVLGVARDELGVERVRVYRLEKS